MRLLLPSIMRQRSKLRVQNRHFERLSPRNEA